MSVNRHVILNHLDSPLKILMWTKGEIALYCIPIFVGICFDQVVVGLAIFGINYWANKQYKKRFGKGQFQAVMYWFFPSSKIKKLPPSHIREYLG